MWSLQASACLLVVSLSPLSPCPCAGMLLSKHSQLLLSPYLSHIFQLSFQLQQLSQMGPSLC